MAPSLDEQDDHFEESEGVSLGETEFTLSGHPGLPGLEGGLEPSVPGPKLPMGAKFQGDLWLFTREYFFEDLTHVAFVGK